MCENELGILEPVKDYCKEISDGGLEVCQVFCSLSPSLAERKAALPRRHGIQTFPASAALERQAYVVVSSATLITGYQNVVLSGSLAEYRRTELPTIFESELQNRIQNENFNCIFSYEKLVNVF